MASRFRTASHRPWLNDLWILLQLGIPMGLTQLVQFSVNTVDVVMIGHMGAEPLAASSLGVVLYFTMWLLGFGPAMAITPIVSQALGADSQDREAVRSAVRMGLWAVGLTFPAACLFFLCAEPVALALGQPSELANAAAPYVLALAPGLPFALGTLILRNFLAALERTNVPLLVIIFTTAANAFFNYLLIFGNWGMPRLELVGAGLASSLSHALGFALLVLYARMEERSRAFDLFKDFWKPQWARLREIVHLGWPIGLAIAFEALLFNAAVFVMGRIGVDEVAAYQVTLNVAAIAFMLPLGLSMAGSIRVALAVGAGDMARVRRATVLTIAVCCAAILFVAIPAVVVPDWVARLYLDSTAETNDAVLALVALFLPVAGAFALFDAVQVAAAQCLRALKDVRLPMIFAGVSYWMIGFPAALGLALFTPVGAIGVWFGLMLGLATAATLMGGRLWLLIRPSVSGSLAMP